MSSDKNVFNKKETSSSRDGQNSSRGSQDFAAKRLSKNGSEKPKDIDKATPLQGQEVFKYLKREDRFKFDQNEKAKKVDNWTEDQRDRIPLASLYADQKRVENQSQEQSETSPESPKAETYSKAFMGTLRRTLKNTSKDFNKKLAKLATDGKNGTFSSAAYPEKYEFGAEKKFEEFHPNEKLKSHPHLNSSTSYLNQVDGYNRNIQDAVFATHDINAVWKNLGDEEKNEVVLQKAHEIQLKIEVASLAAKDVKQGFEQGARIPHMRSRLETFSRSVEELKECASHLWQASQESALKEVDAITFPESKPLPEHLKPLFKLDGSFPRLEKRSGQGEANDFQKRYDDLVIRGDKPIQQLENFVKSIIDNKQDIANSYPEKVTQDSIQQFVFNINKMKRQMQGFIDYSKTVRQALDHPSVTEATLNLSLRALKEYTENAETYVKSVIEQQSNRKA